MSMKKSSLYYGLGVFTLLLLMGIYSCRKTNAIENNTVVETPYSLYFSDTAGTLFVTNDGKVAKVVFTPDGKTCRSVVTSSTNILWAKDNLYFSSNNGQNFNHAFDSLNTSSNYNVGGKPSVAINGLPIDFNQTMIINLPTWGNRDYAICPTPTIAGGTNWLGLVHSDANGAPGSWGLDGYNSYTVAGTVVSHVGKLPVRMTSFTQLTNGYLCGLAFEYGPQISAYAITNHIRYVRNFYKPANDNTAPGNQWTETTSNPDNVGGIGVSSLVGTPLPPTVASGKKDTSFFTLGHYNNRLIAIDRIGRYGAWYSDDYGANWFQYSGLPANVPLLCVASPFEQVSMIGTDSAGLYILNLNTGAWQQSNVGLGTSLVVRNIAFKENILKNSTVQQFIYLATNKGIYQSTNGGLSWTLTIPGNFVSVY